MKYIRTRDGIYELQEAKAGEKYLVKPNRLIPLWNTEAYEIVKQSDNLDELCDCYLEDGENIPTIIAKDMCDEFRKEKALKGGNTLYACIIKRDEKGTHIEPVAKLNEKGELELL